MQEIVSKVAETIVPAAPHGRWQSRDSRDAAPRGELARIGRPFAEVGIHQSSPARVQAKLTVSHPGDSSEKEADRVADTVMQMPASRPAIDRDQDPAVQRACNKCAEEEKKIAPAPEVKEEEKKVAPAPEVKEEEKVQASLDEQALKVDEEDKKLQTKSQSGQAPRVTPELDAQIQSVHGGGAPLAKDAQDFFEPRFGVDLSHVRVQTGSQAAGVARQLEARAFTVGNNITFGAGQYQPSSSEGRRLIAHELTHVIQQGGAGTGATHERE
jgi:hypothetical protein